MERRSTPHSGQGWSSGTPSTEYPQKGHFPSSVTARADSNTASHTTPIAAWARAANAGSVTTSHGSRVPRRAGRAVAGMPRRRSPYRIIRTSSLRSAVVTTTGSSPTARAYPRPGTAHQGAYPHPVTPAHVPVLLEQVVELLDPKPGETLIDCTAGLGGHAAAVAQRLGPDGRVVLFDLDPNNLEKAEARVRAALRPDDPGSARVHAVRANFARAPAWAVEAGVRADMLLADLGFASTQVDDPARGLSFRQPGPLDMRLDPDAPVTAAELVNTLNERDLADLIFRYGEERHARRVAAKLAAERRRAPIDTTDRLASIVRSVVPRNAGSIDGATRTFQALRIATNDEIGSLEALLGSIERAGGRTDEQGRWLNPGARVAIISFHSLEDRPVKRAFAGLAGAGHASPVTRKPVVPTDDEQRANPRSRSAKLRVIRLDGGNAGGND